MEFSIGKQSLQCPYCGFVKTIALGDSASVTEQDYHAALARIAEQRAERVDDAFTAHEVRCTSCGATVQFVGTLTSQHCPYCGTPLQLADVHDAGEGIAVDGVLAFQVTRDGAQKQLHAWVRSRWFAPTRFKRQDLVEKLSGIYTPYWTYDAMTFTRYTGQRGEHYWVTVGTGKNRRRVRKTRWYPAAGDFQLFFDDLLVVATRDLPKQRVDALEPWPLYRCVPFTRELLAGFFARTYDLELDDGFQEADARIAAAIESEVRQRIGGDTQRIHSIETRHDAITYKHLLLPVWMLAYRFRQKVYQVVINAATGEVQGDRPYSAVKITLAILAGLAAVGTVALIAAHR